MFMFTYFQFSLQLLLYFAITIFVVSIPVHIYNSISEAADGVTSIYNGEVVLIGGIIAYNVGWYYFFGFFSLEEALKAAMEEMETPFNYDANGNWEMLTEEERMTQVMKAPNIYRALVFCIAFCSCPYYKKCSET